MKKPDKAFETGLQLLGKYDLDMASLYFENAAENFLEINEVEKAILSYEKLLYCFEELEKTDLADETREKIKKLK